jgi:predicted phosphohydrolase
MTHTMQFQYFSDPHIDFHGRKWAKHLNIQRVADILIIAGDICSPYKSQYDEFLRYVSKMYKYVIIISGNHEYYKIKKNRRSITDTATWIREVDEKIISTNVYPNVKFLQNNSFDIPETPITIYGTTLWSNIKISEEAAVYSSLTDYSETHGIPNLSCNTVRKMYRDDMELMTTFLNNNRDKKVIVVTHHLPSCELIAPQYMDSGINSAFASNIDISPFPNICAWIAGHTHTPIERGIFHVNPMGYTNECNTCTPNKVITI